MTTPILELTEVTRAFGGLIAVSGVSFRLEPGELVGLVGPNGAGKSTTFNLACGYLQPTSGVVRMRGEDIAGRRPDALSCQGLRRTFQTPVSFPELRVIDNVLVGVPIEGALGKALAGAWKSSEAAIRERATSLLDQVGLVERADDHAGDLSGGELRMMEVARQLVSEPDLFLLDEPTAGVAPNLQTRLGELIRSVHEDGAAVLIVEHNLGFLLDLVDRVICMAGGAIIADGTPDEIRQDEGVIAAYLGSSE